MTTDGADGLAVRHGHEHCLLCGSRSPLSPGLAFRPDGDGGVCADLDCDLRLQGYAGLLHGGVAAALLDAAMTNCLFHRGVTALTGDLHVRYLHPIPCDAALAIRARLMKARPPLYRLRAELAREGEVMAWAEASFVRRNAAAAAREKSFVP